MSAAGIAVNNFAADDSLEVRVKKLNAQCGMDFRLKRESIGCWLEDANGHATGLMDEEQLKQWTATFALGYRTAKNGTYR